MKDLRAVSRASGHPARGRVSSPAEAARSLGHLRHGLTQIALGVLFAASVAVPTRVSAEGWEPAGPPGRAQALAFSKGDPEVLYAGTDAGIFRSDDYGASWVPRWAGLSRDAMSIVVHPSNADIVHVSDRKGLHETTDGGRSWHRLRFQNGGYHQVLADPRRPETLYTVHHAGVDTNEGGSWRQIFPQGGLDVDSIEVLQIDPLVAGRLYLVADGLGVFVSEDGGDLWELRENGLPAGHRFPYDLALDPHQMDRAYLAISGQVYVTHDAGLRWEEFGEPFESPARFRPVADLVVPRSGAPRVLVLCEDALWSSDPLTPSWTKDLDFTLLFPDLGGIPSVHELALDPARPGSLFALAVSWLAHSADGGGTWRLANAGLPADVTAIETSARQPDLVWAATTRGVVWRSNDAGRSWHALGRATASPWAGIDALRVDPNEPNEMIATWSWANPSPGDSGVATSHDGGRSWTQIEPPVSIEEDLFFHPENAGEMYGRFEERVVRSSDGGMSWQDFSDGLPVGIGSLFHGLEDAFTLYAYTADGTALYRRTVIESGWTLATENPPLIGDYLAVDPQTRASYIADGAGVRLRNSGSSDWQDFGEGIYQGFGGIIDTSIRMDASSPGTLYYRTRGGQGMYRRSVPCRALDTGRARLKIRHLHRAEADESLTFRGEFLTPAAVPLDPTSTGVAVSVQGAEGQHLLDSLMTSDANWKRSRGGARFALRPGEGSRGNERFTATHHPATGWTSVRFTVRRGEFSSALGAFPKRVDISISGEDARYCARFEFADEACRFRQGGRQIDCR